MKVDKKDLTPRSQSNVQNMDIIADKVEVEEQKNSEISASPLGIDVLNSSPINEEENKKNQIEGQEPKERYEFKNSNMRRVMSGLD